MGFRDRQEFRGARRCFDFLMYTDGFGVSAHFTRPAYPPTAPLKPNEIERLADDRVFFVDPGQKMTFTAMEGVSGFDGENPVPAPILKLSVKEYYHMADFNIFRQKRHQRKVHDHRNHAIGESIQALESATPSYRTADIGRYLENVEFVGDHFVRFWDFYNHLDFRRWIFYSYSGKQRAMSEVIIYTYIRFLKCSLVVPRRTGGF